MMHVDLSDPTAADHITIALAEEPRGALRPLSVDLQAGALHVLLSARKAQTIDEIFHPDFAGTIGGICHAVSSDTQIVNAPDFRIRFRGLGIEGYTLFAQAAEDGLRRFTIRFRRVTGDPLALLKFGRAESEAPGPGDTLRKIDGRISADRLFDQMLAHLYLPLVNLNSFLRTVIEGQRACSGEQFAISTAQLRARTEILQLAFDRMIAELMVARATEDEPSPCQAAGAETGSGPTAPAPVMVRPLEARVA